MTNEQYQRWKDFALRMARTCFKDSRRPSRAWIIEQVESWFRWRDYQEDWDQYNSWDQDRYPLCDHVSEFYSDVLDPPCCRACSQYRYDDDYDESLECRCDEIEDLYYDQFDEQWLSPVRCCIRAGIDFACEPSSGVIGFTAGDVRRMYPEGVPEWVFPPDERLHYWLSDELNGTFAELPDEAQVVL